MPRYFGLGGVIESDQALLSLAPCPDTATPTDFHVHWTACDHQIPHEWERETAFYRHSPVEFQYQVPDLVSVRLRSRQLWVDERAPAARYRRLVEAHLFGPVAAAALYRIDKIPLHASAVCADRSAVLVAGRTSAGKSTLAAAMVAAGARLLSDDVCAIDTRRGDVRCAAGVQHLKLMPDSLAAMASLVTGQFELPDGLSKRVVDLAPAHLAHPLGSGEGGGWLVDSLVIIERMDAPDPTLAELTGGRKLAAVRNQLFRARFMAAAHTAPVLAGLIAFCRSTRVYLLTMPWSLEASHETGRFLVSALRRHHALP